MSAGAVPPSFNLDLLQDLHAAVTLGVKSEHHQFFSVEFVSASKQLKWERTHRFDRFRRLNTIIKATSSGDGAAEEGGGWYLSLALSSQSTTALGLPRE